MQLLLLMLLPLVVVVIGNPLVVRSTYLTVEGYIHEKGKQK